MSPAIDRSPAGPASDDVVAWYAEGFRDSLGDRLLLFDTAGPGLELLRLDADLAAADGFEETLRARVDESRGFSHPAFTRVRAVKWLDDPRPQLALVSEHVPGERLSRVLAVALGRGLRPGPDAVIAVLRRLVPGLAALHERNGRSHGLLVADRIIVTPTGDLVIAEHVLAGALERQRLTAFELWKRHGIAVRQGPGRRVFDQQSDVEQVARLAIAMLCGTIGEPRRMPESPAELLEQVREPLAGPAGRPLDEWLSRALGFGDAPFRTACDAHAALESLLPRETGSWNGWLLPDAAPGGAGAPDDREDPIELQMALGEAGLNTEATLPFAFRLSPLLAPAQPGVAEPTVQAATDLPAAVPATKVRRLWYLTGVLTVLSIVEAVLLVSGRHRPVAVTPVANVPAAARVAAPAPAPPPESAAATPPAAGGLDSRIDQGLAAKAAGGLAATLAARPGAAHVPGTAGSAATAAVVPAATPRPPLSATRGVIGWLHVTSDVEVRVYANGRLLGSTTSGTFRLPEGDHDIMLVNEPAHVRVSQPIRIEPGQTVTIAAASDQ